MKKIISLALTLSMLACMATSAFAATTTDHVVGTRGDHATGTVQESIGDGVYPFATTPGADTEYEIQIAVSAGTIQHKYAVDITYTPVNMSITGGTLTWDVNKLEYVSDGATGLADLIGQEIVITNYSDLSVYVDPQITDNDANDFIAVSYNAGTQIGDAKTEVGKATVGQKTEKKIVYDIKVEAGHQWEEVAEYYAGKFNSTGTTEAVAATLTVVISATA